MTRFSFKEYLLEAVVTPWARIDLNSDEEVVDTALKRCQEAVRAAQHGTILYRGDKSVKTNSGAIIDPKTGRRTSQDGDNVYQELMEYSEDLQHDPKRSSSLILTTAEYIARGYQAPCIVLPFDDADLCVSEYNDFWAWSSKSSQYGKLFSGPKVDITFCSELMREARRANDNAKGVSKWTQVELDALFRLPESVDAICSVLKHKGFSYDKDEIVKACQEGFTKTFGSAIFTRENAGYKVSKIGHIVADDTFPNEIWTDSKCLLFRIAGNEKIMETLGIQLEKDL